MPLETIGLCVHVHVVYVLLKLTTFVANHINSDMK